MVRQLNHRSRLDSRLDLQSGSAVIDDIESTALHARRHLDARVLRRLLHGGVPFVFR